MPLKLAHSSVQTLSLVQTRSNEGIGKPCIIEKTIIDCLLDSGIYGSVSESISQKTSSCFLHRSVSDLHPSKDLLEGKVRIVCRILT